MNRVLVVIICLCTILLASCSLYKDIVEGIDVATVFAEEFCLALTENSFENAKSYLCPYSAPSKEDFEKHIAKLEEFNDIDFSTGIQITNRSDNGWSGINGKYAYEIIFDTLIGEKEITLFFIVIKGEATYEIFSFGVKPKS